MIEDGEQGNIGKKKKSKTARERTQRPFNKTASVLTLAPLKKTARERTQALGCRVQKKRKEEK